MHIENIQGAHKHIKEKRHKKNIMVQERSSSTFSSHSRVTDCVTAAVLFQEKQEENELRALPPPSADQLRAVDAAVLETARLHGISQEDFDVRSSVVARMEEIIKEHLAGLDRP